jgi:hypothetical protein
MCSARLIYHYFSSSPAQEYVLTNQQRFPWRLISSPLVSEEPLFLGQFVSTISHEIYQER